MTDDMGFNECPFCDSRVYDSKCPGCGAVKCKSCGNFTMQEDLGKEFRGANHERIYCKECEADILDCESEDGPCPSCSGRGYVGDSVECPLCHPNLSIPAGILSGYPENDEQIWDGRER